MWWGSGSDPGGSEGEGPSKDPSQSQQLIDLQEQFEQQQTLVAQLKEMLRKTDQSTSVNREKVEEYASTLNKLNARAKLNKTKKNDAKKGEEEEGKGDSDGKKSVIKTPANEKISLLRQQLEENRVKLAQRDKNQKGIEEMVNQIKAQLDDSQTLMNQSGVVQEPQPQQVSYTIETTKEELLNIIGLKDKSIEELTARVQQLEASVLDLQENVKEKDSVIDARTKAITLLSENLSKKGKATLDMLDETKEQMRCMQQNFVSLETDMKNENNRLLVELEIKSGRMEQLANDNGCLQEECAALRNTNSESLNAIENLNSEIVKYKSELAEYEMRIDELNKAHVDLQSKLNEQRETTKQKRSRNKSKSKERTDSQVHLDRIAELEKTVEELSKKTSEGEGDEVKELKKQMDDMNKAMIKMKAQYKAKVKEVQRKTGEGGKGANLESELAKLNQKIIELEEEKGNLQLKLVDVESNKDKEHIEDLENRIEEQRMEIENHIHTIKSLETQITTSVGEVCALKAELANFVHLENAQVCSEMTSVQLEEQLDKQLLQNKQLNERCDLLVKQRAELDERLDALAREKQELSAKLESYVQENMELIDRLEKLSTEKVSSAESIEIVESLTQQEKLEIEAYQKTLEQSDKGKGECEGECESAALDQNPDLSESVSKLTEETSELMEKIELFTAERREVMDKMDLLTTENQQLSTDRACLEQSCETLRQQLAELTETNRTLSEEKNLSAEAARDINDQLQLLRTEFQEHQDAFELQKTQIHDFQQSLRRKMSEERELEDEKQRLRSEVEELRAQLAQSNGNDGLALQVESLTHTNLQLHSEVGRLRSENDSLHDRLLQLQLQAEEAARVNEANNETIELLSVQLSEVKSVMSEHFNEMHKYEAEVENNARTISDLNDQLSELNREIVETEHLMQLKDAEISRLSGRLTQLEQEMQEKDQSFGEACGKLREKCSALEEQIRSNSGSLQDIRGPLESKVQELHAKNKELLDKMKKIAANLKKKVQAYQELEAELKDVTEKWESEAGEKEALAGQVRVAETELLSLRAQLNDKHSECEQFRLSVDTQCQRIQQLISENNASRDRLDELTSLVRGHEAEVQRLRELEHSQTAASDALTAKLQEASVLVDKLQADNSSLQEKNTQLEERAAVSEEHRESLEQLKDKEQRLAEIMALNREMELKLSEREDMQWLLEDANRRIFILDREKDQLYKTVCLQEEKLRTVQQEQDLQQQLEDANDRIVTLDNENMQLYKNVCRMEDQVHTMQQEHDQLLREKTEVIENMESKFNQQLQDLSSQLKEWQVHCEKLQEQVESLTQSELAQRQEVESLRAQLDKAASEAHREVQADVVAEDQCAQLEELQRECLVQQAAEREVDHIIQQAETAVSGKRGDDRPQLLLEKIKTLEFMLFNMEREKDEAVAQGHELSNELTRLIYEWQKFLGQPCRLPVSAEPDLAALEDQIVVGQEPPTPASEETVTVQQTGVLHAVDTADGVVEEIIQTKHAYKCYSENKGEVKASKNLQDYFGGDRGHGDLEVGQTAPPGLGIQSFEFEHVTIPSRPAEEPILQDAFASEEDGWGWSAEEARLEEEHRQQLAAPPPADQVRVAALEERLADLERERTRLLDEVKVCQARSAKLVRKLKELKQTNEHLSHELSCRPGAGPDDLDLAIQEELNTRIQGLERTAAELREERAKDKTEMEGLLRRVDVLTAANDRLVEMKEKQDGEVQLWQLRSRQLSARLEQLEWGDDAGPTAGPPPTVDQADHTDHEPVSSQQLNQKIEELNRTVNDLTLDNEEMQCLLEEQRNLRLEAERALATRPPQESVPDELVQRLQAEIQDLRDHNEQLARQIQELQNQIDVHVQQIDEITQQNAELETHVQRVTAEASSTALERDKTIEGLTTANQELRTQVQQLNEDNQNILTSHINKYESEIATLTENLRQCNEKIEDLCSQNGFLQSQCVEYKQNSSEVQSELSALHAEKLELLKQCEESAKTIANLQNLHDKLASRNTENGQLIARIESLEKSIGELTEQLSCLTKEKQDAESALADKIQSAELLNVTVQQLNTEKHELQLRIQELASITDNPELQRLNERITALTSELEERTRELTLQSHAAQSDRAEFEQKLSLTIEQLSQEWMQKVDRRGDDVAESWKLHLDSRENEFVRVEQQLRLELNDLYNRNQKLLSENEELQGRVAEFVAEKSSDTSDQTICELQDAVAGKQQEILTLSQQLADLGLQLQARNEEILSLKQLSEQTRNLEAARAKNTLLEMEERYEQLICTKDADLESMRAQLAERDGRLEVVQAELQQSDARCLQESGQLAELRRYVDEQTVQMDLLNRELLDKSESYSKVYKELEDNAQALAATNRDLLTRAAEVARLQAAVGQLTEQLAAKTAEREALAAELDGLRRPHRELSTPVHEKRVTFREPVASPLERPARTEPPVAPAPAPDDAAEPVSRAELDLALYMLHQRDVRCEELTLELMRLLEERDTLQLKLSNALRLNEELKGRPAAAASPRRSTGAVPRSKAIMLGATGTELATEATESAADTPSDHKQQLDSKISELKSIGYRDKTLKEDQESRHLQQLSVMQQHRDLAARLPAEAAARLVDANYTLSRDVQSPSKVLLNWLWGRSTPKVNDV